MSPRPHAFGEERPRVSADCHQPAGTTAKGRCEANVISAIRNLQVNYYESTKKIETVTRRSF
jgi:hypothetical protein